MKTMNFPGRVKQRRENALYRLKNPSPQLKERVKEFTPRQVESHNKRVAVQIAILEERTRAVL